MNTQMSNEDFLEMSCNIAESIIENRIGSHMMWEYHEDGSEGLNDEAQDLFNETRDIIVHHLLSKIEITNLP